jgi:hypothetical protein
MSNEYLIISIFVLLLSVIQLIGCLYSDNIGGNPYLIQYDKIIYKKDSNKRTLNERHRRVQRSIDDHLYFSFNSHGIDFKLKLLPSKKSFFANENIEIPPKANESTKFTLADKMPLYEGILVNESNDSHVSGIIIDGVFYGTIKSRHFGRFHIESSKRYNHTLGVESIIYHESDVNHQASPSGDRERKLKRRSTTASESNETKLDLDGHSSCASDRPDVKEWMNNLQKELYKEKQKINVKNLHFIKNSKFIINTIKKYRALIRLIHSTLIMMKNLFINIQKKPICPIKTNLNEVLKNQLGNNFQISEQCVICI